MPLRPIREFLHDHAVSVYFALTVGTQFLLVWLVSNDLVPMKEKVYAARILFPLVYAVGLAWLTDGFEGLGKLVKPLLRWKVHIGWWLFAVFWLTAFAIAMLLVKNLITGEGLGWIQLSFADLKDPQLIRLIVIVSVIEEIAWIGFATSRLAKTMTPFCASLVTGIFWWSWWVPVIAYGEGVIPGLPIPMLMVHYLGIAATCMWVYHFTKSALVVAVMQMFTNVVSLVVPILPHLGGMPVYITYVIAKCVVAYGLFLWFGPKPLFRKLPEQEFVSTLPS